MEMMGGAARTPDAFGGALERPSPMCKPVLAERRSARSTRRGEESGREKSKKSRVQQRFFA
jgi:hypothetical protein